MIKRQLTMTSTKHSEQRQKCSPTQKFAHAILGLAPTRSQRSHKETRHGNRETTTKRLVSTEQLEDLREQTADSGSRTWYTFEHLGFNTCLVLAVVVGLVPIAVVVVVPMARTAGISLPAGSLLVVLHHVVVLLFVARLRCLVLKVTKLA